MTSNLIGEFCKTIRVSGRVGTNSLINGVYAHAGDRFGVPYYQYVAASTTQFLGVDRWYCSQVILVDA